MQPHHIPIPFSQAAFGIVEELKEDGRLVAIIAGSDTGALISDTLFPH